MSNPFSLSVTAVNKLIGKPFYDLSASIDVMARLLDMGLVDGFEIQHIGEWDEREPPREDGGRRVPFWQQSTKYSVEALAEQLEDLPILTVHANRDVGICLCSDEPKDHQRGLALMQESQQLAHLLSASATVHHLWDTWLAEFEPSFLKTAVSAITPQYPNVKLSIENVPTHLSNHTPFDLVQPHDWITVDLRWSALYDQLFLYEKLVDNIANVHLSTVVGADGRFAMHPPWFPENHHQFTFDEAVATICDKWGYSGVLTVELYSLPETKWENLVSALKTFRNTLYLC